MYILHVVSLHCICLLKTGRLIWLYSIVILEVHVMILEISCNMIIHVYYNTFIF